MTIQQVITAVKNEAGTWEQGNTITLVPSMVVAVSEAEGHALVFVPGHSFYLWPSKAAVDTFLQSA